MAPGEGSRTSTSKPAPLSAVRMSWTKAGSAPRLLSTMIEAGRVSLGVVLPVMGPEAVAEVLPGPGAGRARAGVHPADRLPVPGGGDRCDVAGGGAPPAPPARQVRGAPPPTA